jgi:hypothetical protein
MAVNELNWDWLRAVATIFLSEQKNHIVQVWCWQLPGVGTHWLSLNDSHLHGRVQPCV